MIIMVAGDAKSDLWWLVLMVLVLGVAWVATGGPSRPFATGGPFLQPPAPLGSGQPYGWREGDDSWSWISDVDDGPDLRTSIWKDKIRLRPGNARYEEQGNREYVTIEASFGNSEPVSISGWQLRGSRGAFTIPFGAKVLPSDGRSQAFDPIVLPPSGRAVVVSGFFPPIGLVPINVSFQINRCVGYIEAADNVQFSPAITLSCPRGEDEPWLGGLPDECYELVTRWPSCQTPKFERRSDGYDYLNGRRYTLTGQCREFINSHFNYQGCVAYHQTDPDFFTREWRVFLRQTGELWGERRETISLYDNQGQLVDQISY